MDDTKINSPGAGLPDTVRDRMSELGMRPSLRQLAAHTGMPLMTLQRGLSRKQELSLTQAKKLADSLKMSLDELVEECGLA